MLSLADLAEYGLYPVVLVDGCDAPWKSSQLLDLCLVQGLCPSNELAVTPLGEPQHYFGVGVANGRGIEEPGGLVGDDEPLAVGPHLCDRVGEHLDALAREVAALLTLLGLMVVPGLLALMHTPADILTDATSYMLIICRGLAASMFYNLFSSFLRAVGNSRAPLFFLVFSSCLNIALDIFFIVRLGMGVDGVAYATILSQILSALLILFTLTREKGNYGIRWRKLCIDRRSVSLILKLGLPSAIQSAITAFSNVFVQSYINYFGSACMAGYGIYGKIDAFALIPVQSISMSSTTFVGQNWGAKQPARAREGVKTAITMSIVSTAALGLIVFALARLLTGFFSPEAEVIEYGVRFIHIVTPFYLAICFNQIYAGALRGVGDATMPTVIMLVSFVAFRQVYLAVTKALGAGFVAVALAYPVGWILCSTLLIIRYSRSALITGKMPDPD